MAARLGVTRVTDITRLDRVGIPVFTSIRPGAMYGSLCVNAGKGTIPDEARIGAWMEAIEYAVAEPGVAPLEIVPVVARDVLDGRRNPPAILDLCPLMNTPIPLSKPLPCVKAEEILSGASHYIPAELAFLPAPPQCDKLYFGASTNGLASGNTVLEATVHGLCEVIERDIKTFLTLRDTSSLVSEDTFPPVAATLAAKIRAAGLDVYVRYGENAFGIPFFRATIADPMHLTPLFVHGGFGCHPHRSIALLRAITEAVQSRLSFIHGGRDDLTDWHRRIQDIDEAGKQAQYEELVTRASSTASIISFTEIPDFSAEATTLEDCFALLVSALERAGMRSIYRVTFTELTDDLQVVKVIVPLLEEFDPFSRRVGRRLRDYVQS
jgi:ribosomal protein S12 methylthiotransferase accessory factor